MPSISGDRVLVVYHKAKYDAKKFFAEDVMYTVSMDKGKTWSAPRFGTNIGSLSGGTQDVDVPTCLFTSGGDCVCLWADDRVSANDLYLAGLRVPTLRKQGTSNSWVIENFLSSRNGELALLLFTDFGTTPEPILMGLNAWQVGYAPNFRIVKGAQLSLVTSVMIGMPGVLTAVQNGKAAFNLPQGLGIWHVIGLGIDPKSQSFTWYTDPALF